MKRKRYARIMSFGVPMRLPTPMGDRRADMYSVNQSKTRPFSSTIHQDLVEYESGESPSSPPNEESWTAGASSSRVIRVHSIPPGSAPGVKARKFKGPTVAGLLSNINFIVLLLVRINIRHLRIG